MNAWAGFYLVDNAYPRTDVSVRAYTHRGGTLLAEETFSTHDAAETWIARRVEDAMARIFVTYTAGAVTFRGRMEGSGGIVGDYAKTIHPGQSLGGRTFEEWVRLKPSSIDARDLTPRAAG